MAITNNKAVDNNMPESRRLKIKLKATHGHPYIKAGEVFEVHPSQEAQLKERKWAVDEKADHTKVKNPAVPLSHGKQIDEVEELKEEPATK